MSATVTLAGIEISGVNPTGRKNEYRYDGTVRFKVEGAGISFGYAHSFRDQDTIPGAVTVGADLLKRELERLAADTLKVLTRRRAIVEDEDAEGLDDL